MPKKKHEPLERGTFSYAETQAMIVQLGIDATNDVLNYEFWLNSTYQVMKRRLVNTNPKATVPDIFWLSIRRLDGKQVRSWDDVQHMKNELCGDDREGVELYPAEDRNMPFHNRVNLYVVDDPHYRWPFGIPG